MPFFDRRQGGGAARAELGVAEAELESARLRLESDIARERQRLTATRAEVMNLRENVLSPAEQTFSLSQEGYRAGKFSLFDVLDTDKHCWKCVTRIWKHWSVITIPLLPWIVCLDENLFLLEITP